MPYFTLCFGPWAPKGSTTNDLRPHCIQVGYAEYDQSFIPVDPEPFQRHVETLRVLSTMAELATQIPSQAGIEVGLRESVDLALRQAVAALPEDVGFHSDLVPESAPAAG